MALSTQLHVVTGKGGTGKTTIAAALALALADAGRTVLLCEVEGRQGLAQVLDVPPIPYAEKKVATGLGGGEVYAIAIDAESALMEYLAMFYKLGRAGKLLDKFGVIDFATTIAPGVRDVLLTGKVYEAARRKKGGGFQYDAVVMDAPPTGRITRFLGVNDELAGLAKVGPVKRQADSIMGMMRGKSARIHLVTLLEEMPVQETLDGVAELRREKFPVGHVLPNLVRPDLVSAATSAALADDSFGAEEVATALGHAGLPTDGAQALVDEAVAQVARQDLQDEQRALLNGSGLQITEIPALPGGIDPSALLELAALLREQGVAR